MPIFGGDKPFTSITVKVNQLCTPNRNADLDDDSIELYIQDLISLIKLQSLGAVEAARAIRKKIKYGNNVKEQLLALHLLELLVLNAGGKIGSTIASDYKLCDLLRGIVAGTANCGLGGPYEKDVVRRTRELSIGWKHELGNIDGYNGLASIYKSIPKPKSQGHQRSRSGADRAMSREDRDFSHEGRSEARSSEPRYGYRAASESVSRDSSPVGRKSPPPPRPKTMSPYSVKKEEKSKARKNKKSRRKGKYADAEYKIPQINYKVEAPRIRTAIANCHTHTTALSNILLALGPGANPMDDKRASEEFDKCRKIRRSILRYLQYVGAGDSSQKSAEIVALDEEFLGSLIMANEQLVSVFQKFDKACGYTEANPAQYHQDDENESSDESYYSSDSSEEEESIAGRLQDMQVQEASSKLDEVISAPPEEYREVPQPERKAPEPERIPLHRQETGLSTASGDPFGDPFGDKNELR